MRATLGLASVAWSCTSDAEPVAVDVGVSPDVGGAGGGTADAGPSEGDVLAPPDGRTPDAGAGETVESPDVDAPDVDAPDVDASDVDAAGASADGGTEGDAADAADEGPAPSGPFASGLCGAGAAAPVPAAGEGTSPGASGPARLGPGAHSNVVLGALEDPSVVAPPVALGAVDTTFDLDAITYDVRVPAGYDGGEPLGLILHISAGNNGGTGPGAYHEALDEGRWLWVAPDDAGNPVNIDQRMGRAVLGAWRAMELWNVDPARVLAMGQSGGARSASMLAYQYPQLFAGTLAWCGANYPREVAQLYETHDPGSHYEFWGEFFFPTVGGVPYLEHYRGFDRRTALMTSFDDFREGDLMNIHHGGFKVDGLASRLLETPGGHCAADAAQMRDGLAWVRHPLHAVVAREFGDAEDAADGGLVAVSGGVTQADGAVRLEVGEGGAAGAAAANRWHWADPQGAVLEMGLDVSAAPDASVEVGVRPFDAELHGGAPAAIPVTVGDADGPLWAVRVVREAEAARVEVRAGVAVDGTLAAVFSAPLGDWDGVSVLPLVIHVWESELQVDLGVHLGAPTVAEGVALLDDARTVRLRWEGAVPGGAEAWDAAVGAVLTAGVEGPSGSVARLERLSVRDAVGMACEADTP